MMSKIIFNPLLLSNSVTISEKSEQVSLENNEQIN